MKWSVSEWDSKDTVGDAIETAGESNDDLVWFAKVGDSDGEISI